MGSFNSKLFQPFTIVANQKWAFKPKAIRNIENYLNMPILVLDDYKKHLWEAESLFKSLKKENKIARGNGDLTLLIEENNSNYYIYLFSSSNDLLETYQTSKLFDNSLHKIVNLDFKHKYGQQIKLIVMYGLLWCKLNLFESPIVYKNMSLPETIETKLSDFKNLNHLFDGDYFNNTRCLILDDYKMENEMIYQISWKKNMDKKFINLNDNSISIVNPVNLIQSHIHSINEDSSIYKIADIIHKLEVIL